MLMMIGAILASSTISNTFANPFMASIARVSLASSMDDIKASSTVGAYLFALQLVSTEEKCVYLLRSCRHDVTQSTQGLQLDRHVSQAR